MRKARIHEYGDAAGIRHDDVPRPNPGPGEVPARVAATSFNAGEIALRAGMLQAVVPLTLPYMFGWDVAGTVAELGPGVSAFALGDRVVGRLDAGGAAAEYVLADPAHLVPAPTSIPLTDAAALPVAGLTAWQAVFDHARVLAGQRVPINEAGGGMGGFAVQLAKYAGAEVLATASPRSTAATDVAEASDGPGDVLLNLAPISPREAAQLLPAVRPGGVVVSITTPFDPPPESRVRATHMITRNDTADLSVFVHLVDTGTVTLDVSASYPLRDFALVHRRAESGRTRGKILILP